MREFYPMAGYAPGNRYREATLASMLDDVARRHPTREALVFLERRLAYAEVRLEVERCARGLLALGVEPGDKVALWLPNRPEWLVVQHAVARIGAVLVALNTRHRAHELDYVLRQSGAAVLLLQDHSGPVDFLERLDEVLPRLHARDPDRLGFERFPKLRHAVCLADDVYGGTTGTRTSSPRATTQRSTRRSAAGSRSSRRTGCSPSSTPRARPRSRKAR